jgi:hypothetical protein
MVDLQVESTPRMRQEYQVTKTDVGLRRHQLARMRAVIENIGAMAGGAFDAERRWRSSSARMPNTAASTAARCKRGNGGCEGFRMTAHRNEATGTGAVVRKPPKEEPAVEVAT